MSGTVRPTRRDERRIQTVREIKQLAMEQVSKGGPEAVSLSGIVREMSMSPAAVYRYFASRDALLSDLVVDAYNELADSLVALERGTDTADSHLDAVLRGVRAWALDHPNAYRLIFQTSIGSGKDFAAERTIPAASRSMAVIIGALERVASQSEQVSSQTVPDRNDAASAAFRAWADRSGLANLSADTALLAFQAWTRLHGIISLELGGHLAATGIGAAVLFDAEVEIIRTAAAGVGVRAQA
jgi:AcrR family transcriptional regulator